MVTLFKKEVRYYLNNPIGYIILMLFAGFINFLFIKDVFITGSASMKPFFGVIPWLLIVFIPALGMRIFSEEKRSNTIEILLTLPVSETQIVLAKLLALLLVVCIGLILTLGMPLSLMIFASLYFPEIAVGYLGIILFSLMSIQICIYMSLLTKNQVVAFLTSLLILFFLLGFSTEFFSPLLPKIVQDTLLYCAPLYHLENFSKGIIDIRSVFYFISITVVFLLLSIIELEKKT